MDFEDAFNLTVFDNNQPVGANFDDPRGEEIWKLTVAEPILTKTWMNLTTECTQGGMYRAYITGLYERMNPLRYDASFDNCTLRLFEEGGGINILVDKVIIRSNIIYQLQSMKMKIGNNMLGDWQYIGTGEVNLHGVQHEYVEIAVDSPTEEVNFLVDAKFRVT